MPPVHSFREGPQEEKEGEEEIRHLDKQPGNCTRLLSFRKARLRRSLTNAFHLSQGSGEKRKINKWKKSWDTFVLSEEQTPISQCTGHVEKKDELSLFCCPHPTHQGGRTPLIAYALPSVPSFPSSLILEGLDARLVINHESISPH